MEIKPGYKQTEIGVIPEDWEVYTIQELIDQGCILYHMDGNHGSFYPRNKEFKTHGVPYIGANDFEQGSVSFLKCKYLSYHRASSMKKGIARDGDILFAHNATVGPVARLNTEYPFVILSTSATAYRTDNKRLFNEWLLYIMQSDFFVRQYTANMSQTTRNQVPITMQRKLLVPVSRPDEQNLIAAVLSNIDSLITSLEKLIEKKKLIKQGVMQELLTGKRRLPGFSGEWETKRYGDIFQFLSTANYTREDLTDTGSLKYIHYGDIHTKFENYVDLSDALIPTIQDCRLKNYPLLESGDIIMVDASEDYSGVGKSVEVINSNGCKAISGLHTILLRDISKIFADGYRAFIHSIPSVKAQLDFYATGMKVYSISKGNLARIEIPVPPKDEQEAIVNTLGRFVDEIKGLDIRLAKCKLLKQAMMQELLTGRIRLI